MKIVIILYCNTIWFIHNSADDEIIWDAIDILHGMMRVDQNGEICLLKNFDELLVEFGSNFPLQLFPFKRLINDIEENIPWPLYQFLDKVH